MIAEAQALIINMATTTISFMSDVVTNIWPYFLSIAAIWFSVGFILRRVFNNR